MLLLILGTAAFLRLYRYDLPDVINDEVFYGFRSIGLVDTINSPFQPTPFEWYEEIPWWARLSFHDHPPLGFYIQHIFFKIFGANLLGLRMPSILAGILSVFLVYLIAKKLFSNESPALLAAAILAVNNYHVWVSRIGLQESLVIFFILLATLLFLKALENTKYFYPTVVAVGFAILMKYTAVILLPIFLTYLVSRRRDLLSWKRISWSIVILLVLASPVIIYNLALYRSRGHFDFQLSYLLGQNVPEWQVRPGRTVGTVLDKLKRIFTQFGRGYGAVFSGLTLISLSAWYKFRKNPAVLLFTLSIAFLIALFLAIGPQERFMAMLSPFLAIMIAAGVVWLVSRWKSSLVLVGLFLFVEAVYTVNSYLVINPVGQAPWQYSVLRFDHNIWGYNQLEDFFQDTMAGIYPSRVLKLKYPFAERLQDQAITQAEAAGKTAYPILFITDTTIHGPSALWYVTRHTLYDGWAMVNSEFYAQVINKDSEFFVREGFQDFVFVKAADTLLRTDNEGLEAKALEETLIRSGPKPYLIIGPQGKAAFKIYRFQSM